MPKPNIIVLILAAGGSSRLGRPKQLLKWRNSNLLQNAVNTATDSDASRTVLVLGAYFSEIILEIETNNVEVFKNETWKNGLGNSIAFGVKSVLEKYPETDGVLVMLADQPLIDRSYLNTLINSFEINKKQIIASTYVNKKYGVPVIFDKHYFKELISLNDDEGAKHIITKYISNVTSKKHDVLFGDIDTFDDYERLFLANHQ